MTDLAQQVRTCLETSGHSQAEIARRLSISTKHMSQMLTGKTAMSLERAQQISAACGYRLTVTITPDMAAIRTAIAEAEEAKIDRRSSDQASWHSNGMIAAANLIRGGRQ